MIAKQKTHTLVRSHDFEETEFGVNSEDVQHVIHLLRNQIYSNKTLAVIREYTTNAVDAHVESGKDDLPIEVTLPTKFEPTFKVRDFGSGLNDEEIKNLYTRYCKSTKRQSNSFTGQLGIGCKAGFAYGDSFGIVSYCNGIKNTYNAQVDESAKGKVILLDSSPTTEPSGMEIIISVADSDVDTFRTESLELFSFFKVKPDVKNLCKDKIKEKSICLQGDYWTLYKEESNTRYLYGRNFHATAIMGNIGYPINVNNIKNAPKEIKVLCSSSNLYVEFDIGELSIAPSREALEYTKATQEAIIQKMLEVKSDLEKIAAEQLSSSSDLYEAKCNYSIVVNSLPWDIQSTLKSSFTWNGIKILSHQFHKPYGVSWGSPELTLKMYSKEEDSKNPDGFRLKNSIQYNVNAHKTNLIAINDCESSHGLALRARTIFKQNPDLKNIYVYAFKDDSWKEKTFKHNNFDKVSDKYLVYLSNFEKAKSKKSSSARTGKSKNSRQNIQLFELSSRASSSDSYNWINVDSEDLPTEGVYVPILRYKIVNSDSTEGLLNTRNLIHLMGEIKKHNGTETKIYGVRVKDAAKLDNSKWMHFNTWLDKNIKKIITIKDCNRHLKESTQKKISDIEFMQSDSFVKMSCDIVDNNNIIKRTIKFMPNRPKNGWSSLHCTMDDLIYDLSLINPKYASESFILNRANINLEVTAEEASESFEQYPLLKHIDFYEWRDTKEKAKDAIQYINQIDQLNKVS